MIPAVWNAVTALYQLIIFVYLYFLYDNANIPYAVVITLLDYVRLSFYYVS